MNHKKAIGFLVVFLVVVIVTLWFWPHQSTGPARVWQPVTHRFDPLRCARGKCKVLFQTPQPGDRFALIVDPAVNDETAQWADCLASVTQCVDTAGRFDDPGVLRRCVSKSQCPSACRQRFATIAAKADDAKAVWQLFEQQFVHRGGICVPGG